MKVLEISKKDLKHNINLMKNIIVGKEKDDNGNKIQMIAVVKSNGYGLDIIQISKFLIENGVNFLAVAMVDEAIALRKAKIDCKLLMLTPVYDENDIETLLDNNVILTIGSMDELHKIEEILAKRNEEAECHIKVDTGLARYGFLYDNPEIIECFEEAKRLKITGMYSHCSRADKEKWTRTQFNRFLDVVAGVRASGFDPGMLHFSESTASILYPDMRLNAVRVGSLIQGRTLVKEFGFKPVGVFKTNIEEIKIVPKGYNISYTNTYKTKRETKIAVLPVGYIDGFLMKKGRDTFSFIDNIVSVLMEVKKIFKDNSLKVNIKGKKYKIIGRIGMYHAIVDVTGADVKVGDEVIMDIEPLNVNNNIKREYN